MLSILAPLAEKVASLPQATLPVAVTPLSSELALSMARAFDEAVELNKTTPITAWRESGLKKTIAVILCLKVVNDIVNCARSAPSISHICHAWSRHVSTTTTTWY